MLDIDLFLKKEKEKRLDYAKKLNEEYEHDKKERENKLYKTSARNSQTQKLPTTNIKSEMPLSIFGALDQIQKADNVLRKWVLEDHHHKLDEMLLDKSKNEYFGESIRTAEEQTLKGQPDNVWKRAKEITANCAEIQYLPVKVEENQLEPSDYGEALMAVLSLMPPALSGYLYHECNDVAREKYFMLRFFAGGQKKSILTDEWL
jgi:hypothetical protein